MALEVTVVVYFLVLKFFMAWSLEEFLRSLIGGEYDMSSTNWCSIRTARNKNYKYH